VPFTVSCSPAPLTFTIWPNWQKTIYKSLGSIAFVAFYFLSNKVQRNSSLDWFLPTATLMGLFVLIRRERIEIYSDSLIFHRLYLGISRTKSVPFAEVLGVEWHEANEEGESKSPSYLEFYTLADSIRAGITLSFEEYEQFREQVRMMYPELGRRWGKAVVRSKDLTLLNLS
jgi:hypothetical protein